MENNVKSQKIPFGTRLKKFFGGFTLYEKIWFCSITVLAVLFAFLFPETDDPTYTLKLDKSSYSVTSSSFDTLDFSDTIGSFVITGVTINGEEYDMSYANVAEYTVDSEDKNTLTLKLPVSVNKDSVIELECYPDSDDGVLSLTITNKDNEKLYSNEIEVKAGEYNGYAVTENPPAYMISVKWITFLYLLDVILNVACELLISKQSKWNFIVSLAVEITEIAICIFCMYRFATMAVTLFFWIPIDIISFIVWNRKRDEKKPELTEVRKLTWWQDLILIAAIAVWTVGVGYLLTLIEVEGGIFANNVIAKNIAAYLDACASAVGIANGVFILLRYREQWIAWYIVAIIETVINIMAGQWILLVLKAGYLTNTTYGYIKWTKYIKSHNAALAPASTPSAPAEPTEEVEPVVE